MILSPRLQSLLPRILLKRKPYMVNLRQQRLLLRFVVAFRRCHPSGCCCGSRGCCCCSRRRRHTAAVAAAKALFETQAGLKLLAPPLPVYSDGDAGSAVGSKRRGPTDSFVAAAKRSRTLALREKTRRAWLACRAREKVSRLEMLRKATRRAYQRAHDDAAESSATENSAAEI